MPFYSRHSSDGSDRFLGGVHDEEEEDCHNFFMNLIYMSSSFGEDIERHYEGSDADVLPPTSDIEESKEEKEKQYQKEYHKRYFQEKQYSPYFRQTKVYAC